MGNIMLGTTLLTTSGKAKDIICSANEQVAIRSEWIMYNLISTKTYKIYVFRRHSWYQCYRSVDCPSVCLSVRLSRWCNCDNL